MFLQTLILLRIQLLVERFFSLLVKQRVSEYKIHINIQFCKIKKRDS